MKDVQTINQARTVVYAALGFIPGIKDLKIEVMAPSGPNPMANFIEQGKGVYVAKYIPTVLGVYQERVSSESNGDEVLDAYECVEYDLNKLHTQIEQLQKTVNKLEIAVNKGGYIN